ncbi:alpha/beta hydrolase [Robbsia sp. KACC 23696]|uniref:alpha/beta hydrolase family protein n=1 Tax=Robbsia sp. KACC 23696 TaxID=3149231 RepID=UPI00325AABBB
MNVYRALTLCASLSFALIGCALDDDPNSLMAAQAHARQIAAAARLQRIDIPTARYTIATFSRLQSADRPIRVYIEGDGLAWTQVDLPSLDPTPRQATGLLLAASDTSDNVVYLARPCQFVEGPARHGCRIPDWTDARFASRIVDAENAALDTFVARAPGQGVELVGYSGGGAIAILMAARRHDVMSIRTVAGNLESEAVNRLHKVSAMPASLDPLNVVGRVATIPQVHFTGARDTVVPPVIAHDFVERIQLSHGRCASTVVVPEMSHEGAWASVWPALLQRPLCAT